MERSDTDIILEEFEKTFSSGEKIYSDQNGEYTQDEWDELELKNFKDQSHITLRKIQQALNDALQSNDEVLIATAITFISDKIYDIEIPYGDLIKKLQQ